MTPPPVIARSGNDEAISCPAVIATPSARNDTLQGNPKLKALNPKQIPVSKLKVQNCFGHSILFRILDLGLGICMPLSLRGAAEANSEWDSSLYARNRLRNLLPRRDCHAFSSQ